MATVKADSPTLAIPSSIGATIVDIVKADYSYLEDTVASSSHCEG